MSIAGVISDEMVQLIERVNTLEVMSPEWDAAIKQLGELRLKAEAALHASPGAQPTLGPTQGQPSGTAKHPDAQKCPNCSNTLWKLDRFDDGKRVVTRDKCLVCEYVDSDTEEIETRE